MKKISKIIQKKFNIKKETYILSISLAIIFVIIVTLSSFLYFSGTLNKVFKFDKEPEAVMEVEFKDNNNIALNSEISDNQLVKRFTVKNTGNLETVYDIYLKDIVNDFSDKENVVYNLMSESGATTKILSFPTENTKIISNEVITPGDVHSYILTIEFKDSSKITESDKNKILKSNIEIIEEKNVVLEYKSSFILTLLAQAINVAAEFLVVLALFVKFKLLKTYDVNEILLGFSILWLGYGVFDVFFRGWDRFYQLIVRGDFDTLLIRPRSLFITVMGSDIAYEKFSIIFIALGLLIYSFIKVAVVITMAKIILLILTVISTIIFYLSLFIIGAALSFKTIQGLEVVNVFTYGSRQIAQYPIDLYGRIVRLVFTYVLPVSLINYYPIKFMSGYTNNYLYMLLPFSVLILLLISIKIFKIGLNSYQGTGS